jgi:hypothetical protein
MFAGVYRFSRPLLLHGAFGPRRLRDNSHLGIRCFGFQWGDLYSSKNEELIEIAQNFLPMIADTITRLTSTS